MDESAQGETKDEFFKRMDETVLSGFKTIGLALGRKLNLFEAFGRSGQPVTSTQLATRANCKERYVREWLHHMVVCDVVEVDDSGKLFMLSADKQQVLTDPNNLVHSLSSIIPYLMIPHREIVECFRDDGPSGVPHELVSPELVEYTEIASERLCSVADDLLQDNDDFRTSVENGVRVCEVGPGEGKMLLHWAGQFPNSRFIGVELSENLIKSFNQQIAARGLSNIEVHNLDASTLPGDWNDSLDYILVRDVLHDLPYPSQVLSSLYRCLKPGGTLFVIEEDISSNVAEAKRIPREKRAGQVMYAVSIYHCLASSLYYPGSLGLGPCCGRTAIIELLLAAGFEVLGTPKTSEDCMVNIRCKKPL